MHAPLFEARSPLRSALGAFPRPAGWTGRLSLQLPRQRPHCGADVLAAAPFCDIPSHLSLTKSVLQ